MNLNFIGIGGATNLELGSNCAFYLKDNKLLVIDCGEGCAEKLQKSNAFKNIKELNIVLTHTHSDHIAGLGVLIWYSNFVLKIKPKIIENSVTFKNSIIQILTLNGVSFNLYEFIKPNKFKIDNISLKPIPTSHTSTLECFGIMFENSFGKYYYTGDTNDINFIKKLIEDKNIKKIYCEVSEESYNVHLSYKDILKLKCKKLILMHFSSVNLYNKAIEDGFNVAKIVNKK